jgi:nitrogen regulatory protein PII-like uncharacterized protein
MTKLKPRDWKDLSVEEKFEAIIGIVQDLVDLLYDLENDVLDATTNKT